MKVIQPSSVWPSTEWPCRARRPGNIASNSALRTEEAR
ncbi:hypothetical protein SANTM175S_09152 [Streptomyces antimycoticus]